MYLIFNQWLILRVASNFPMAYIRVASQTYVLQHIIKWQTDLIPNKMFKNIKLKHWPEYVPLIIYQFHSYKQLMRNIFINFSKLNALYSMYYVSLTIVLSYMESGCELCGLYYCSGTARAARYGYLRNFTLTFLIPI